jgi:Family of unknown function (DUF6055)/Concanavalin A-like lectin/glucanases superfamily
MSGKGITGKSAMPWLILLLTTFCHTLSAADAPVITVDPATAMTANWSAEWNTAGNLESWTATGATATVSGGVLTGTTSSTDSRVQRSNFTGGPDLDLGYNDFIELKIRVPASYAGFIQIYYGTTSYTVATSTGGTTTAATTGFATTRVFTIPAAIIPKDGAFHTYRIAAGLEPAWRATLRDLRIDPVDGSGSSGLPYAIDYIRIGDEPGATVYQPRYTSECPAAGGSTPSAAQFGPGQAVLSMESKHFRFLWNSAVAAHASWTADMAHGTLRNLEETWQLYANKLGYREVAYAIGTTSGTPYKMNVTSWYGGYWAGPDDYSGTAYARLNITPDGLRVDPPTWVIPHELMHCFQFHNNSGYLPGEWFEFHANYGRERWLQWYQSLYSGSSGIDPTALRSAHLNIGAGRDYYLCWPFFQYIDENPDQLPDLGEGTAVKLWQQTQQNEYPFTTLERLTPTSTLKDIVGGFARRGVTYNYSSKAAIQSALAGFGEPLDNAATSRWQFTDLVQRPDLPTVWRVPYEMAPMQGAYAIHELVPTGSGANRVVTVNLRGLADAARGADWRASFIVIADDGSERYSSLWSQGENSVTLAANENKLYLSVAAAPSTFYYGGADELVYPYRSHPAKVRFPYEMIVTGATPKQRDNGATTGLVQHANGGGWKASTATVASTAYIGPNARVLGSAVVSDTARIEDYAVVSGSAQVSGSAVISGHAWVRGNAVISGNAKARDWALIEGGTVTSSARVLEHGNVKGGTVTDIATVKGSAGTLQGTLSGNAIIDGDYGDYFSGRDVANGIAFGHQPYVGVPDSWIKALPTGLYAAYDFATAHDSRILDQYGVTDGFTAGSPTWVAADAKRKGFLSLNGSNQYVSLDRSLADLRDFTFSAWVKPLGGAANQAVLWMGATTSRRLCFTPNDGTGKATFSIRNGGSDQTLSTTALPLNTWTHIAISLNGTTGVLYVNGTAAATGAISIRPDQLLAANTATGLQQNYLGRSEGSAMAMFRGCIDEVRFYGTALAAADMAAMQPITSPVSSGTLHVDLRATASSAGSATWVNGGTIGNFTAVRSPSKSTNVGSTGVPGVLFNGTNQAYTGPNSVADIDGSGDRSIEVWAYNPALVEEETMVSWGHRGTDRSDMALNFGNHADWGAVTHWGDDLGWGTPPTANAWHHLVYTYDGATTAKVYIDGSLATTRTLGGVLSTFSGEPINLACQRDTANGTRSHFFSGYLNTIRIHGGVLTPEQIAANYALGPAGAPANATPGVSAISDQTLNPGGTLSLPITVSDSDTDLSGVTLTAASGNEALIPAANVAFSGSGASRTATITANNTAGTTPLTFTASDGNSTSNVSANFTVLTPAQAWRLQAFGTINDSANAADAADPDGDGASNLIERAFVMNPLASDASLLPSMVKDASTLSIIYRRSIVATDMTYLVQESTDLTPGSWHAASGTETILSDDGTVRSIRFTTPLDGATRKFLRVQVTSS